jgi:hypothetical protein
MLIGSRDEVWDECFIAEYLLRCRLYVRAFSFLVRTEIDKLCTGKMTYDPVG